MTDDLVKRLRDLAKSEHSDFSIGDEAADRIRELQSRVNKLVSEVYWLRCDAVKWKKKP
jgi:hypothetical protein